MIERPSAEEEKVLEESTQGIEALLNRASRIEGQVRGVKNMLENEAHCIDPISRITLFTSLTVFTTSTKSAAGDGGAPGMLARSSTAALSVGRVFVPTDNSCCRWLPGRPEWVRSVVRLLLGGDSGEDLTPA